VPAYPPLARQARVHGTVVFEVVISKDGAVDELHTVSGHPLLIPAAVDAVKQWRYKPYAVKTQIAVVFTMTPAR
jgi:protein TonB